MTEDRPAVRVAIVGAGNIAGGCHMPAVQAQNGEATVIAVVDVDQERAKAFAAQWDIPAAYDDLRQMLREERPDLVIVCTPPIAHREAVTTCLDAGAWVWCEKPPTLSVAEYDAVSSHEREGGPYVSYVFQHRFGSAARALREQIRTGRLGAPLVGVCHTLWYRDDAYFDVPWRGKWETEGGGPTMGHGIHQMDLMLSLMGDWTEVRAAMGTLAREVETEDVSMAMVRFANGAMVSMVNSLLSARETSYLRFDFPEATVELSHLYGYDNSHWTWTPAPHRAKATPAEIGAPLDDEASSHAAQLRVLLRSLRAGQRPEASGDDGRRVLAFIAALYQSATTGRPVTPDMLTPDNPFYHSMCGRLGIAQDNAVKENTDV
ncbi:Gfo/Idh/MocA family oxidoreductase [Streptomyces sp. DG2A-72]|uniref:Gfo/Idh/MocA family protein n=1 Tax=Streptomyces sp. DG2A-72 TaxID=3051386 RepID=UPI00265BBED1|nr:Gfo/Idh/MocA family oxidoreductase [Streptomyces sp. DG2A-72]MDO0938141.1 Gfo/Idh/MocA family oxidoreductase [Streptomyces sp. DG2A-72]